MLLSNFFVNRWSNWY